MTRRCCALLLAVSVGFASSAFGGNPNAPGGGGGGGGGGTTSYTLSGGNTRVVVSATYAYSVYDMATGAVLLTQNRASFTIGGKVYTTSTLRNVTVAGGTLVGTIDIANAKSKGTATVSMALSGDVLSVDYTNISAGGAPTVVSESFADQGERIYGVWEHAYGASIDNRGVSKPYAGKEVFDGTSSSPVSDVGGVFAASARAPFYMTNKNIGIYTPTQAAGSYALAVNSSSVQTFNGSELRYKVFHGNSLKDVMGKYNLAAGPSRLPPLWAFDSIWWRDDAHGIPTGSGAHNAQELLIEDATKLQQYQIPASAIWIDRPYGSNTANRDSNVAGWGNMDFEAAAFPNPDQMVTDLRARGLRTMLWVANKANNNLYTQANASGYLFSGYSNSPALDLRNANALSFMQGQLSTLVNAAQIYPAAGISGFKIDRGGEGEMPEALVNQQTTLMQQASAAALQSGVGEDYFAFARNINDTGRQYAAVWSGDPDTTWQAFGTSLINGIRSGMINFPVWGSDVGGYAGSAPSKELYARWFGFGAYSPMMEVMQMPGRTVWFDYDAGLISIASAAAQTHHDLMPYNYSLAAENRLTGVPVLRAMALEFQSDTTAQTLATQYMFGPSLLVAPVITQGATSRSVYLPAGRWLDYNNRVSKYNGGTNVTAAAPLGVVPLFVREGAIIPRGDILQTNNNWTANWAPALRVECFPGVAGGSAASSTFNYFDGTGASAITCQTAGDGVHIATTLPYGGTFDIYCTAPTAVMVNGVATSDYSYDAGTKLLRVPFAAGGVTVDVLGSGSMWP